MNDKTKEQLTKEIDKLNKRIAGLETVETERKKAKEELKASYQQLQASEQQLRAANQQLDASNQQLRASEQEREKMLHDMGERVKELQCLYGTSTSIREHATAAEVLHEVAALIPPAWHYPEITRGRICFDGKEYISEPFKESKWKQSSDIVLAGKRRGSVDVFYMEKRPEFDEGPFLKEERHLIDTIARTLSDDIERKQAEEELKAANQQLQASEQQLKASNQQLIASEQQLKAYNQQLIASEQQLRAANQQLDASNQQLRASEQEIRKMEENWRESFNSLEDIMILIDRDFNIEKINANGLKLLGKSEKAVLGKKCYEIIHGENVLCKGCPLKKSLETGKVESLERFEKGFGRYFSAKISPIFDEKGNIVRFVDLLRDITDRKQLEEERMKTEKLESIGILAGGIAHDFNNILAVILGNVSLAKISLDNKEEVVELLTETENASVRATKLTKQLLTFAKGGAPVKEITELTELIRETTQFSLRGSNVQYRASISPDLWATEVDRGQISQAIGNLVINAQQAMPEGGTINIKAKNVTVTPKDNLPLKEGNYVKISLEDKGTGITEDHLSKIFDPYFTTKQMGSGLGLATTYSIIHRHDGHIAVESELGVGTTFHIYLPASSIKVKKKEAVKEDTATTTGKMLVMDDNESVRKFVINVLKGFGHEVEEAVDGTEAIKLYKKAMKSGKPFDVVIMDLTIPGGMGGKEAIKKLLELDPDAKAIVSSGYANDPVISNFEAYGFSGFIFKPYKLDELKRVLNEVLSERNK